jgi:cytochrome P450
VGLARLETRLVLREVVNRFPNLRPDEGITDLSGDALGRARIRVPLLV